MECCIKEVLRILNEVTYGELILKDDPKFLKRKERVKELSKLGKPKYIGMTKTGTIVFETQGINDVYEQRIVFEDWKDILSIIIAEVNKLSGKKVFNELAKQADVRVYCNDPSFKYWGFQYISYMKDYAYGRRERRKPKIRNPKLRGRLCKHLTYLLDNLHKYGTIIGNDFIDLYFK